MKVTMSSSQPWISGKVVPGYGVASGRAADTPYPAGTIALQAPFFLTRGIDLSRYHPGTLNVDVAPHIARPARPVFDGHLRWFGDLEERFLLMPIRLRWQAGVHEGLWYYPHPATKPAHVQRPTVVELLLPWLEGLSPGAVVEVSFPAAGQAAGEAGE